MKTLLVCSLFVVVAVALPLQGDSNNDPSWTDPLIKLDAPGMIAYNGYPVENHVVQTPDGYLLGVQRIPQGIKQPAVSLGNPRPAILLQHGLLADSTNWISNLPTQSLGYILADAGYDVWLGNVRGNTYSRNHVSLDPSGAKFWQFSWDEMAAYDIPAMVTYILQNTGNKQIYYAGHSQGTLVMFAALSQNQTLAQQIKAFFALGPVSTVGHITSKIRYFAPLVDPVSLLMSVVGYNEFQPSDNLVHSLANSMCNTDSKEVVDDFCDNLLFLTMGKKTDLMNITRIPVYFSHFPSGTSTQNFAHFGQMVNSGAMAKYDFGYWGNKKNYGTPYPPTYSPENIKVPTALFWGQVDQLADPADVAILLGKLNPKYLAGNFSYVNYGHADFLWSLTANTDVYSVILDLMKKY